MRDPAWDFMRVAMASLARTAIFPIQDVLRLDSSARMNTPGTMGGNWLWRARPIMLRAGWRELSPFDRRTQSSVTPLGGHSQVSVRRQQLLLRQDLPGLLHELDGQLSPTAQVGGWLV